MNSSSLELDLGIDLHRVCPPEETLARVRPAMARAGITRVADQTWLDSVGIPAFQAVRPYSKNLSVSQGKGITPLLAEVSAVMEALEYWIAETIPMSRTKSTIDDMRPHLPYDPTTVDCHKPNFIGGHTLCTWLPAESLTGSGATYVPQQIVDFDWTVPKLPHLWQPPGFMPSTNGLASGNTRDEAVYHALCELIERDCAERATELPLSEWRWIDPSTTTGLNRRLCEKFERAENQIEIIDTTNELGVPALYVRVWSPSFPVRIVGFGCDLNREVALSRALTEAAQSRIMYISGGRDDLADFIPHSPANKGRFPPIEKEHVASFSDVATNPAGKSIADDIRDLVERLSTRRGLTPLVVDLTHQQVDFSVVKVVCPGLLFSRHGVRGG